MLEFDTNFHLYINLGKISIFTMMILLIYKQIIALHSFRFLISFISVVSFSAYHFCTHFVRFTSKYFWVFLKIINSIVLWILASMCSLLVYWNAVDFYMFYLVSYNLTELTYVSSASFLRILYIDRHVIYKEGQLYVFFLLCMHFISLSCIIVWTRISNTVLSNVMGADVHASFPSLGKSV